jgi:hypothetical protein
MKQIENLEELRSEISRMRALAKGQEEQIKNDLKSIRDDLRPENIFWNVVSSVSGLKFQKGNLFKDGITYGLSYLFQRFILKTERKMENRFYTIIDSVFEKIKSVLNKFSGAEAKRDERQQDKKDFFTNE